MGETVAGNSNLTTRYSYRQTNNGKPQSIIEHITEILPEFFMKIHVFIRKNIPDCFNVVIGFRPKCVFIIINNPQFRMELNPDYMGIDCMFQDFCNFTVNR